MRWERQRQIIQKMCVREAFVARLIRGEGLDDIRSKQPPLILRFHSGQEKRATAEDNFAKSMTNHNIMILQNVSNFVWFGFECAYFD
jgi:hypothetical protein